MRKKEKKEVKQHLRARQWWEAKSCANCVMVGKAWSAWSVEGRRVKKNTEVERQAAIQCGHQYMYVWTMGEIPCGCNFHIKVMGVYQYLRCKERVYQVLCVWRRGFMYIYSIIEVSMCVRRYTVIHLIIPPNNGT